MTPDFGKYVKDINVRYKAKWRGKRSDDNTGYEVANDYWLLSLWNSSATAPAIIIMTARSVMAEISRLIVKINQYLASNDK
jgi:hypothetical protein